VLPYGHSLAPVFAFGCGAPADSFLPGAAINGAKGARLPLLARKPWDVKTATVIDRPNGEKERAGGLLENVPAHIGPSSPAYSVRSTCWCERRFLSVSAPPSA